MFWGEASKQSSPTAPSPSHAGDWSAAGSGAEPRGSTADVLQSTADPQPQALPAWLPHTPKPPVAGPHVMLPNLGCRHPMCWVLSPLGAVPGRPAARPPPGPAEPPGPPPAGSRSAERPPGQPPTRTPEKHELCVVLLGQLRLHFPAWWCVTDLLQFVEGAGAAACLQLERQHAAQQRPCLRLAQRPQLLAQHPRQLQGLLQVLVPASFRGTPAMGRGRGELGRPRVAQLGLGVQREGSVGGTPA